MPIFEYKCETCEKTFEILQKNSNPILNCSEINSSCEINSKLEKQISGFSFTGFGEKKIEPSISPKQETFGTGCGCHGTSSCPGKNTLAKYGLE
jgi:putative FmdB family regulatory protein